MISDILLRAAASRTKHLSKEIDHFSIEKVGGKFYVYAHPMKNNFNRKKIGTYPDYATAKANVDRILDLKIEAYGTQILFDNDK